MSLQEIIRLKHNTARLGRLRELCSLRGLNASEGIVARILIIDDSPTVVLSMARLLEEDGHQVETVKSFQELPGYLRTSPPDLIMLDLEMPGLSGVAWAKFIHSYHPTKLAVIIHSAQPWSVLDAAAREIDAAGIIPKGASPDAVQAIVNRVLRRRRRAMA